MPLHVADLKPQRGTLHSYLFENEIIGIPLGLFYSFEIPLAPFDTGNSAYKQPLQTSLRMDDIVFKSSTDVQVKNWKHLLGKTFQLGIVDATGDGSMYASELHCRFDAEIHFLSLQENVFNTALLLTFDWGESSGVEQDVPGPILLHAELEFTGFHGIGYGITAENLPQFIDMEAYWAVPDSHGYYRPS